MKVVHDWLKDYLGDSIPPAEKIEELFNFHAFEVEGIESVGKQQVIDIDVLPNRSSDCLSHRGIARELAAILNTQLVKDPLTAELAFSTEKPPIAISIADPEACPAFSATLITDVEVKESPDWLKDRLEAIGQRPINNIVDATNYVMFAIGQPMHAYDADRFPKGDDGEWQINVRRAEAGEAVSLIAEKGSESERKLTLNDRELLIVDGSTNTPIGLAGIKGGQFAAITSETTNIIIEAAYFNPTLVRQTAKRHGILTDASRRFENTLPACQLHFYAQQEIINLIADIAGGQFAGLTHASPGYRTTNEQIDPLPFSVERANALLGLSLEEGEMQSLLARLGISLYRNEQNALVARGPNWRTDLLIEEDFIEEVGRLYGYEHIESLVPEAVPLTEVNSRHYYSERVRETLTELGFSEVITSSFRQKDEIQLKNALAADKSYLRSSLKSNLTEALERNASLSDLFGMPDTRLFEIGTVFSKSESGVAEHVSLCLGVRVKAGGYSGKEDKILLEAIAALETSLTSKLEFVIDQGVAEVNFTDVYLSLPLPTVYEPIVAAPEILYRPFSPYPHISRDIALWVKEGTTAAEVQQVLNETAGALRVRTTLFDEFSKDGRTSYAYRLVFQSHETTLTDSEVNIIMDGIYQAVAEKGWEVR